jgi:hypothetical protein
MNEYAATLRAVANELIMARRYDEAVAILHLLIGSGGDDGLNLYHLGHVRYVMGDYLAAETALRASTLIEPGRASALNDLAASLFRQQRDAEALGYIRQALAVEPGMAEAVATDAIWLLRHGRFREGWRRYEARRHSQQAIGMTREFPQPQWMGEPIHDRTILLHAEQGFGDTIQFARYAPLVAARGAKVILEVPPGLGRVLRDLPGLTQLTEFGLPLPAFDLYCPLVSLPLAFQTDLDSIPASIPYITADPARVFEWRGRLGPRRGARIGIAWSGNPGHREDRYRSIPLARLASLFADRPDREFHVLQRDLRDADRATLAGMPHLRDHSAALLDFADTAALIALMDLVITVDTSVAHLAGAMGWPVWLMLASVGDWRWLVERDDSPWYPSMWLFRQSRRGDWAEVFDRVGTQLDAMFG